MKNIGLLAFIGVTLLVVALIVWLKPQNQPSNVAQQPLPVASTVERTTQAATDLLTQTPQSRTPIFQTGLEQLPASLVGTDVAGEILIDENRNLHVTRGLRDLFDYFLATIGEEPLPTIVQRVKAYIRHRTPEPAQSQAVALFDQYVAYRSALRHIPEAGGKAADQINLAAIAQQKDGEQQLRQQFFDRKTIQAFFGDDDAYDQYTLQSLQISQDPQLSDAEKAKKIADLAQNLPDSIREAIRDATQYQHLEQLSAEWRARGGSAAELRQIRLNLVGAEATERLEALDRENLEWQRRINLYLTEHQKILNNPSWSAEQKQLMILSLRRQQGFTEQEQLRLPAFEQMAAQGTQSPAP